MFKNSKIVPLFSPTCLLEFPKIPTYTFITSYTFIDFEEICSPTRLFRPTRLLGTIEYNFVGT